MDLANSIYHNDISEYRSGPIINGVLSPVRFAVCMATYTRPNNKSPEYLQRSLFSVLNQTASNWHIFLVGDKYESQDEFNTIVSLMPPSKITAVNLPVAPERENISDLENRWKVAGANAFNHAHKLALDANYDYILHLDDDDFFHTKKIQLLNYICSVFPIPAFMFHYSDYVLDLVLPRFHCPPLEEGVILPNHELCIHKSSRHTCIQSLGPSNLLPVPEDCIHSSYCIHKSVMKNFSFSGWRPGKTTYLEGDKQFLNYLHHYLYCNPAAFVVFLPFNLCDHKIQREFIPDPEPLDSNHSS